MRDQPFVEDAVQVRQLLALTGQYASVDDELTGSENLIMISRLLGFPRPLARSRSRALLEQFELSAAGGRARLVIGSMILHFCPSD